MKKGVVVFRCVLFLVQLSFASEKIKDCTFKGIPLQGKVKFVKNFGDIKIKVVDSFEDFKVKVRENFTNSCGEWRIVENFPDFTVEIVDAFADIDFKFVEYFPGVVE